jgi:hypothetical protein
VVADHQGSRHQGGIGALRNRSAFSPNCRRRRIETSAGRQPEIEPVALAGALSLSIQVESCPKCLQLFGIMLWSVIDSS